MYKQFETYPDSIGNIFSSKSKGLLEQNITTLAASGNSLASKFTYIYNSKIAIKFE